MFAIVIYFTHCIIAATAVRAQCLHQPDCTAMLTTRQVLRQKTRLHIISVTGQSPYEDFAIQAWNRMKQYLGPTDNFTHVCEVGCGSVAVDGQRLTHILPMAESAFPSGHCMRNGSHCEGYMFSSMKFPWGLIHEHRSLQERGGPMPNWWFIKDDDTYVHVERLMALVDGYDYQKERVAAGFYNPYHREGFDCNLVYDRTFQTLYNGTFYAGSGWLISAALAHALVVDNGDRWLKLQEAEIRNGCPYYDAHIFQVLSWIEDVIVLKNSGIQTMEPCYERYLCSQCTEGDAKLVSHHMKFDRTQFNDSYALDHAERCFS